MRKCLLSTNDFSDKMYFALSCPAGASVAGFDMTVDNTGVYALHSMYAEVRWGGTVTASGGTAISPVCIDEPRVSPTATAKQNPTGFSGGTGADFVWRGLWLPNSNVQKFEAEFSGPVYVPPGGLFDLMAAGPAANHYGVSINIWFEE